MQFSCIKSKKKKDYPDRVFEKHHIEMRTHPLGPIWAFQKGLSFI